MTGYILDPIQEVGSDPDGDGRIDAIVLTATVQANVSGLWRVYGSLDANGSWSGNYTEINLPVGTSDVAMEFPGWRVRFGQANGPYQVSISLYHFDSGFFWSQTYATAAYDWTAFEMRVEFSGGFSERVIDANGDGLYNYLEVSGILDVGQAGRYRVEATLYDQAGAMWIASSHSQSNYLVGASPFRVWFDGNRIRTTGIAGPYTVTLELSETEPMDVYQRRSYLTASYLPSQFAHQPIAFRPSISDAPVERDGNGKPDVLRITVPVDVMIPGDYFVAGSLHLGYYSTLYAQGGAWLPAGSGVFVLEFSGFEILGNYTDGPYQVDVYVGENVSAYWITTTHTTGAYPFDSWDNPYGNLVSPIEVIPRDTDSDGQFNEVEVRVTIEAKRRADFRISFSLRIGGDYLEDQVAETGGPGAFSVSHTFPGWWIHALKWNGTYAFFVSLYAEWSWLEGELRNEPYTWDQFEPALRLLGPPAFTPVDTDGNGRYNQLIVTFPLRVELEGFYDLYLHARDPTWGASTYANQRRFLTEGTVDLTMRLSGFDLGRFAGDAFLEFYANVRDGSWSAPAALTWSGTFAIPDPTVFESPGIVTVTFQFIAPETLGCCGAVNLASYANAHNVWVSAGIDFAVADLPDADYTFVVSAWAQPDHSYAAVGTIEAPLPALVTVPLTLVGRTNDVTVEFGPWSGGSAWSDETYEPGGQLRFYADLFGEPDGTATEDELADYQRAWGLDPIRWIDVTLDGVAVAASSGPSTFTGAGIVSSAAAVRIQSQGQLSVAATAAASHLISVKLYYFGAPLETSTTVRVPIGWAVTIDDAPAEVEVLVLSPREVRLRPTAPRFGAYVVDLTAAVTATPSVIRGRIVDETGIPIEGAAVTLLRDGSEVGSGTTPADGRFTFSGLSAGAYEVRVHAPGYLDATRAVDIGTDEVIDLGDVPLARTTGGSVDGRVIDPDGRAIAGARVALRNESGEVTATTTNASGGFTFADVPSGEYTIRVVAPGFVDRDLAVTVASEATHMGDIALARRPSSPPGGDGFPLLGAAIVVAIVASAAALILLRRRGAREPPKQEGQPPGQQG